MSDLSHLRLENTAQGVPYTHPGGGGGVEFGLPPRDRAPHARKLRGDLQQVQTDAAATRQQQGLPTVGDGDVVAVRSEQDFDLKLDSLERRRSGIELLSVKLEQGVTVAKVFVPHGKYVMLLEIIDDYENKVATKSGLPRNRELVESVSSIRLAAVRDFWQDTLPFPPADENLWWEVWLRGTVRQPAGIHRAFSDAARPLQIRVTDQFVTFPERVVTLAYGNQRQLSASLNLLSTIAELRRAKDLATEYVELPARDQRDFVDDSVARLVAPRADAPAVCVLDSGVNRAHPLIAPALSEQDTQTVNPEWGTADDRYQHGTEMAGIALYGDLTDVLSTSGPIRLRHRLESVKLIPPPPGVNERENYGWVTIQAVARAEIQAPQRNRAICMAITADDRDLGLPSLWSGTVDQLCAGAGEEETRRLMLLAAGNLRQEIVQPEYQYHVWNCERGGIEDPGQAWNALTVGAYTERVFIQHQDFRGWQPVAQSGDLSPTSRTSLPWPPENQSGWPLKPDIVMEGGNYAQHGNERIGIDDLSVLTTVLPPIGGRLLQTTRDTSPATAAAARMAAVIWSYYPRLWPETVRGLLVHSARWTQAMVARYPADTRAPIQRRLRCYGYGVPSLQRALWSAENAATLIHEGELQPYQRVGSDVRSNQMHVHTLPWPVQVLQDLGEVPVTMRVTLSYFIEPSPARIGWTRKHRYQSHGLRFDVIRPTEDVDAFRQRLSRAEWEDDQRPDNAAETRNWVIGDQGRRRGSLHSDWWTGTASELASCNSIAIYPVTGWWRERPHLNKCGQIARYSLVVSIEAPDVNVDLYTPIVNQATVTTELE